MTRELKENIFAVPIPDYANNIHIENNVIFWTDNISEYNIDCVMLPYGEYTLLFTTSTIDEEKAGEIVEQYPTVDLLLCNLWRNYMIKDNECMYNLDTATESFQSILQSKSLDTGSNYAIIRKV